MVEYHYNIDTEKNMANMSYTEKIIWFKAYLVTIKSHFFLLLYVIY